MEATIAGFTQDEIKAMTDVKNDENAELMAECAQDIQDLLAGKSIPPNQMANTAYLQKMKNYMKDNSGYLMKHPDIAQGMFDYMNELSPIVSRNMVEALDKQLGKEGLTSMAGQAMGMPQSQAAAPGMEQPVGPDNTAVDQQVLANYGRK